jgi:dynactin complex subunit
MINKDYLSQFAGSMKETAEKEQKFKQDIIDLLCDMSYTLEKMYDLMKEFDNKTDSGDIFNRMVVKNIVIGEE